MPPRPEAERALVSIDLEMTSPRPDQQEIIEVGAVKFVGDRVVGTFQTLVQPPVALPYNIQVLTGIRPAELTRAPKLETIAPRLLQFIGDSPLVAHTVSSDVGALARKGIVLQNDQIDTHEARLDPAAPARQLFARVAGSALRDRPADPAPRSARRAGHPPPVQPADRAGLRARPGRASRDQRADRAADVAVALHLHGRRGSALARTGLGRHLDPRRARGEARRRCGQPRHRLGPRARASRFGRLRRPARSTSRRLLS